MSGFGTLATGMAGLLPLMLFAAASIAAAQSTDVQEDGNSGTQQVENTDRRQPVGLADGRDEDGQIYIAAVHGDWDVRCVRADDGPDPCQMYQLLEDDSGNPVAEITVFPLSGNIDFVAGAAIVTPLETLLTERLEISVDGGEVRRHPFLWCSAAGCVSHIGLNEADLTAFRRGFQAKVSIVPALAPNRTIDLTVSLTGFIASYDDVFARSRN